MRVQHNRTSETVVDKNADVSKARSCFCNCSACTVCCVEAVALLLNCCDSKARGCDSNRSACTVVHDVLCVGTRCLRDVFTMCVYYIYDNCFARDITLPAKSYFSTLSAFCFLFPLDFHSRWNSGRVYEDLQPSRADFFYECVDFVRSDS